MSRKRIFRCVPCDELFSGRALYDYHMNAHKRTAPVKRKELPPRPTCYTGPVGNDPGTTEGEPRK